MNFGDTVTIIEGDVESTATYISERHLDGHDGTGGEPLITVAFFQQMMGSDVEGQPVPIDISGTQARNAMVQWRFDVAHESVPIEQYVGPRWRSEEFTTTPPIGIHPEPPISEPPTVQPIDEEENGEETEEEGAEGQEEGVLDRPRKKKKRRV
jgi:hypothetical protein